MTSFCLERVKEVYMAVYVPNSKSNHKTFKINMPFQTSNQAMSDRTPVV